MDTTGGREPFPGIPARGRWRASLARNGAALVLAALVLLALLGPMMVRHPPSDLAGIELNDALLPPAWVDGGSSRYWLGTDDQGRDVLSTLVFGLRTSLLVATSAVALAMVVGLALGLTAGYLGGWVDALLMRLADVQLSFPALLIALLVNGVVRSAWPRIGDEAGVAISILVLAIAMASWVLFARTARAGAMVELRKDYILAARLAGSRGHAIMLGHLLPNVLGPAVVIGAINLGTAVITEATLSFLGIGMPPTEPSLGTMIRVGNDFMFSGQWWLIAFPGSVLLALCIALNLLGDRLRETLDPRQRAR